MSRRRFIAGFFLRLAVLYTLLMAVWPVVKRPYGTIYRSFGDLCFSRLGSSGAARFEPWPADEEVKDTIVHLFNNTVPGAKIEKMMPISSRYTEYMPTAVVVSLILATPLPWPRRLLALAVGLALVHLFIAAWLGISILDDLSDPLAQIPTHGFLLPAALKSVIKFLVEFVAESVIACAFIAPVLIWIVAVFRRKDREWLLTQILPPAPQSDVSGKAA